MDFFNSAVDVLQTLVIALGAGLGIWGGINLMEGYGNDNPGAKCVPRSPAASRVHANSISAVSSPQPKEDASSFPSVFSGFKI